MTYSLLKFLIVFSISLTAVATEPEQIRSIYINVLGLKFDQCRDQKGKWEYMPDINDTRALGAGKCFAVSCTINNKKELVDRCLNYSEISEFSKKIRPTPNSKKSDSLEYAEECHFEDVNHEFIACPNGERYVRTKKGIVNNDRDNTKRVDRNTNTPNSKIDNNGTQR